MTNDTPSSDIHSPASPSTSAPASASASASDSSVAAHTAAETGGTATGTATATLPDDRADGTRATGATEALPTGALPTATLPPAGQAHGGGIPQTPAGSAPYGSPAAPPALTYYTQVKTNVLGIVTLVLGVLGFGLVPVITGHIALNQIKKTGEDGRGLTLAGLILGYVTLAGWLLVAAFWIAVAGFAAFGALFTGAWVN
jgi:hypothetical protein